MVVPRLRKYCDKEKVDKIVAMMDQGPGSSLETNSSFNQFEL